MFNNWKNAKINKKNEKNAKLFKLVDTNNDTSESKYLQKNLQVRNLQPRISASKKSAPKNISKLGYIDAVFQDGPFVPETCFN